MMRVPQNGNRLSIRAETAEILTQTLDGNRQDVPIDASTLSRYCNADCANPLEMLVAMIDALDADRGALLLAYLEDAYEARHGEDCGTPLEALFEMLDAKDNGEDGTRFLTVSRQYSESELRRWLRQSREYDHIADKTRRKAARRLAEMRGRKPSKVSGWRQPEVRKAGQS